MLNNNPLWAEAQAKEYECQRIWYEDLERMKRLDNMAPRTVPDEFPAGYMLNDAPIGAVDPGMPQIGFDDGGLRFRIVR